MNGMKGMPAFRYGSLLYTPFKTLPYHYWFYGIMVVFLPKNHVFREDRFDDEWFTWVKIFLYFDSVHIILMKCTRNGIDGFGFAKLMRVWYGSKQNTKMHF